MGYIAPDGASLRLQKRKRTISFQLILRDRTKDLQDFIASLQKKQVLCDLNAII